MAGLLDRLFGGNNPQSTTAVAEQTGATASSPFLQYLQKNQGAARSTAESLMGPKPEADYSMPLAMMGLSILGQQPGGAPLGTIARGAAGAMPYFMQEKEKQEEYDKQARDLAMKLGMKDYEIMSSIGEGTGLKDYGGNVIHEPTFKAAFQETGDMEEAFRQATVIRDRGAPEKNAEALADKRAELEQLKFTGADPDKIQQKQDEIEALEWQLKPGERDPGMAFFQDEEGNIVMVQGTGEEMAAGMQRINDEKVARKIQTKRQATDDMLGYASRIIEISDNASTYAQGRLGGMASSIGAWNKAITEGLSGPRGSQFQQEVGSNPISKLEELRNDPESENYMTPALYERLSQIGQENTQLLSNIIGLGYATARASDEGGRLSNSDVAFALQRIGYNLDAFLNDPAATRAGVLELAGKGVKEYETFLDYNQPSLIENDKLLNKAIKEYGFEWSGGRRGQLTYPGGRTESQYSGDDEPQPDASGQLPGSSAGGQDQPPEVKTQEAYDALPPGTTYIAPDGTIRTKGS